MRYHELGRTGLQTSIVGLGTGGKSVLGQRRGHSEQESHRVVFKALDLGINLFDTSPVYIDSEAILGRALQAGGVTHRVIISTKVVPYILVDGTAEVISADDVVASVEMSLRRLHRDTLDIVHLHAVLPEVYEDVMKRLYPTLVRLREQGKIQFIGISEQARADADQTVASRAARSELFDVIMLRYNLFHQGADRRVFPVTTDKGTGVMSMCPVDPPITRPDELRTWLEGLKGIGKLTDEALSPTDPVQCWIEHGTSALASAGMRFAASQPAIDVVITGTANVDHLEHNVQTALNCSLSPNDVAAVRRIYSSLDEGRL